MIEQPVYLNCAHSMWKLLLLRLKHYFDAPCSLSSYCLYVTLVLHMLVAVCTYTLCCVRSCILILVGKHSRLGPPNFCNALTGNAWCIPSLTPLLIAYSLLLAPAVHWPVLLAVRRVKFKRLIKTLLQHEFHEYVDFRAARNKSCLLQTMHVKHFSVCIIQGV